MRGDPEVGRIGDVVGMKPGAVEPLVAAGDPVEQPSVVHDRVLYRQVGSQPPIPFVFAIDSRCDQILFTVDIHAKQGLRDATRMWHPQENGHRVPDVRCEVGHICGGAVMMRTTPQLSRQHRLQC